MQILIITILSISLLIGNTVRPCATQQGTPSTSSSMTVMSTGATYKLTVVIQEVTKRSGKIYVGLANSAETFDGESAKKMILEVPASGEISATFDNLAPGHYAVRLFQDLNDNQKIDFSGQIPNEPFGFSNVTMLMGPPTFDQCAFDLAENKTIKVGMMSL
jgi:uncharacterized protein (DUF2141 family)